MLFKNVWFYIFYPKAPIKRIKYHPWKVIASDGSSLLVKNLSTGKIHQVSSAEFSNNWTTKEHLVQLLNLHPKA